MCDKKIVEQVVEQAKNRLLESSVRMISQDLLPNDLQEILRDRKVIGLCEKGEIDLFFDYFSENSYLLQDENIQIMQYIKEVEELFHNKDNKSALTEAVKKLEAAVGP